MKGNVLFESSHGKSPPEALPPAFAPQHATKHCGFREEGAGGGSYSPRGASLTGARRHRPGVAWICLIAGLFAFDLLFAKQGRALDSYVSITAPVAGSTVHGLVAIATSSSAGVSWISLSVDGESIASDPISAALAGSVLLDSAIVPDGDHSLTVIGYDPNDVPIAHSTVLLNVQNSLTASSSASSCVATEPAEDTSGVSPAPPPGHPVIAAVSNPVLVGSTFTITGTNFTHHPVVNFFVSTATGPANAGPLIPAAGSSATKLIVPVPPGVSQGEGFAAVQVVNTDTGFAASNVGYALLRGSAAAGLPSISTIDGKGLDPSSMNPRFAVANVDTVLRPGKSITIGGSGFDVINGVAVDVFCACPGGKLPTAFLAPRNPNLKSASLTFTLPASAPFGPASIAVSNAGAKKLYARRSNAVSAPVGARINILSVSQSGSVFTVSGFSDLTVINFFNTQAGKVINLGGFAGAGASKIALKILSSTRFTFNLPAHAMAAPSFLQALNPPFVPFSSTANDPCAAFTVKKLAATPIRLTPTPHPTPTPRRLTASPKPTLTPKPPIPVGHLSNLAPKAVLPLESSCAALANAANLPETTAENVNDGTGWNNNRQIWTTPSYFYANAGRSGLAPASAFARVDGKYAGTTQDIIKWAACKWGVDEDWAYAESSQEHGWVQDCAQLHGGSTCHGGGDCNNPDSDSGGENANLSFLGFPVTDSSASFVGTNGFGDSGCGGQWASWGIIQSKVQSFEWYTWPMIALSTAWGEDYRWAKYRACVNGDYANWFGRNADYLNAVARAQSNPNGVVPAGQAGPANLFSRETNLQYLGLGCIGTHYSGQWYDSGAVSYLTSSGWGFLYILNNAAWPGARR
jgi:hypothetical protein